MQFLALFFFALVCPSFTQSQDDSTYLIGAGIADITGPAADVNMMGYAKGSQKSAGIHTRLQSRAFIIADAEDTNRVVFVNIDACMGAQIVKMQVVKKLQAKYDNVYNDSNVCISGIHTHSGPGGFLQYLLFDITGLGFLQQSMDAIVDGIVRSVSRAHDRVKPGKLYVNSGELLESNINRSPTAYLNNPDEERAKYQYNVDKTMVVLRMTDDKGKNIGMISWFAVHCTSMNNTNGLISSDNKGYAAQLFERDMNNGSFPGQGEFVAAFAQSNEGDVSPNTRGPHCMDTGLPCDTEHSTCNGRNEMCVSPGPGEDMFDSTKIIGTHQYKKAKELFAGATTPVRGPVGFRHQFVKMPGYPVKINATHTAKTCLPAMGYSFAAGTTDGPGDFSFTQGTTKGNLLWDVVRDFLAEPSDEQVNCHAPKPILLDTGEMSEPYAWQPEIVPTQAFQIGQLFLLAVPGEFTTMSGRRLRDSFNWTITTNGYTGEPPIPVVAGLSNTYSDYITTFEEYQVQRYEGASTVYGPHTLEAYIQVFNGLGEALVKNTAVPAGPAPPDLLPKQLSFIPPVIFDHAPSGSDFGSVLVDVHGTYKQGEIVEATFVSANPRNNLKTEQTFVKVEYTKDNITWATVATDSMWETRFMWKRTSTLLGESEATIRWEVPPSASPGYYRLTLLGDSKSLTGTITPYSGSSSVFKVVASPDAHLARQLESNETPRNSWNTL